MEIRRDDLSGPEIRALISEHLHHMFETSPPESVHALDLEGLKKPDVTFWSLWIEGSWLAAARSRNWVASMARSNRCVRLTHIADKVSPAICSPICWKKRGSADTVR